MFVGLSSTKEPLALFHNVNDHLLYNKDKENKGQPVVCYLYEVQNWVPPKSVKHLVGHRVTLYSHDGEQILSAGILIQDARHPNVYCIGSQYFNVNDVRATGDKIFYKFKF